MKLQCLPCDVRWPTRLPLPLSHPHQVTVKGQNLDREAVKAGVAKAGKATEFWQ